MRPIDADALIKSVQGYNDAGWLEEQVDKQPTVDVIEVVHAHWEYDPNGMDWNMGAGEWKTFNIDNWTNYGHGDSIQIKTEDGDVYLFHASNCTLINRDYVGGNNEVRILWKMYYAR